MQKEQKYYDKGRCPVCGSGNITYDGSINKDGDYIFYKAVCDNCNTKFDEYYELIYAGIENIVKGNKNVKNV